MIDLTHSELFKDLTAIYENNIAVDLHNNYVCTELLFDSDKRLLSISFKSRVDAGFKKETCTLYFEEATVILFLLFLQKTSDSGTINIFYRGRFEKEGHIFDHNAQGENYYYIEFENGDKVELFSKKVFFNITSS